MNILVTLNSGLGADTGPNFNLTADVGSVTPSTATKGDLLAGKFVDVNTSATQITVTSTGTCTTSIVLNIVGQTTTTTTSAASSFVLGYNIGNFFTACTNYTTSPVTYYSITAATLQVGTTLYNEASLTTKVSPGFYSNGADWFQCNINGVVIATGSCSTTSTTSTTSTSTTSTSTTTTEAPTTTTTSTTLGPEIFSLGYDASVGWQSCYASQSNYYAYTGETLVNGLSLYTDNTLSTPAPMGYYSNGANYWYIPPACKEYTFTNNLGYDESVSYYDCNGVVQILLVYDGTTSSAVCLDSIINLNGLTDNYNGAGACPTSTTGIFQDETPCPTTSTTSTTSTSTSTTSTSTSTTSTSTSTTSTSTSTSTTTEPPTTTSTSSTTSTTTQPGDTSTTTTSTTAAPTSTTTSTTEPPTSTTTSTSSTTSTTTIPLPPGETSTTTTSTTEPPTTTTSTSTSTSTSTTEPPTTTTSTSTTTTTTTAAPQCNYDGLSIVCDGTTTTTTTEPPTTTTTTSGGGGTTTTTTAGINYIAYPADKYGCSGGSCGSFIETTEIAFPDTFTVTINKWYVSLSGDGYAYQLTSTTPSAGPGLVMQESTMNTCGAACSI